jgi:DNA-binding NtrC family response regulator
MSRYNAKPFRLDDVRKAITSAMERAQLRRENRQLCNQVNDGRSGMRIITQDATMQRLRETAQQIAPTGCNVLITGESGTGKKLLTNGLFGHEKGAFTSAGEKRSGPIEVADGGSLFLDEIGDMLLASRSSCCATTTSRGTSANWKT